jgi:glucose/arabinose dehydrogenase
MNHFSGVNRYRALWAGATVAASVAVVLSACAQAPPSSELVVVQAQPATHLILPADLPQPFATDSVNNGPHLGPRPAGAALYVPPGFTIKAVCTELNGPRWMTVAPNGDVFVSESTSGRVSVLRSANGQAPTVSHFATGLHQPFGIAFYPSGADPQYVYIADTDEVLRFPYRSGDLEATGQPEQIAALPGGGYNQHWTRTIVFSPDDRRLYIAIGSKENIGIDPVPRACVMTCNPDGSDMRVFASGLRNAVGLSFNPVTGALWAAVNERDQMGDHLPPDYVTSVKEGGFYGWPYYYIGGNHDPRMPQRPDLQSKVIVPDVLLEPHCAALSIEWDTGRQFPAEYRNDGFVAMHGSWNRADRVGYEVARIPMKRDGTPKNGGYEDFVWGWKVSNDVVWGRPVSVAFLKDGSMLISDDGSSTIWRVTYVGK